jgi:hypothetical protein
MVNYYDLAFAGAIGGIHKLYDDLYDNPEFGKRLSHRPYLLETLKITFGLGFAVISLRYTTFYVALMSCYVLTYALKPLDYGVYEMSGMIGGLILVPFLAWHPSVFCSPKFFVWYAVSMILLGTGLVDSNEEVSFAKLHLRALFAVLISCLLVAHHVFDLLDPGITVYIGFLLGSATLSSAYQLHMLAS